MKMVSGLKNPALSLMLVNQKSQFAAYAKFTTHTGVLLHNLLKWNFNGIKTFAKSKIPSLQRGKEWPPNLLVLNVQVKTSASDAFGKKGHSKHIFFYRSLSQLMEMFAF